MTLVDSRAVRTFLASFLVLFLEVALIRWMPAYIRLLSYFSNFILLASFLGIGIGCLLAPSRSRLFRWFPLIQAVVVGAVYFFRLEIGVATQGSIYFSSGTADDVVLVESTMLLPVIFVIVAALFITLAQRMGREMATLPPLRGYTVNLVGSLAGVVAFAVMSWLELSPSLWFGIAALSAVPLILTREPVVGAMGDLSSEIRTTRVAGVVRRDVATSAFTRRIVAAANIALLIATVALVHVMARGALWSPYYKITVAQEGEDTVVEVNNIFHQSMAPVEHKEYFYQWPYATFGDAFEDVLILGAGSGTDVAAALKHGAKRVDAVEIDPMIIRLGRERHPDRPYSDPRVTVVNDDARHFLRTTPKKYDLVVFALIDSLTLQSSFSGVRLESYMFTEESFRAVRDRLQPDGVLVIYNYFRERWLVDRLANTAAAAFGEEPRVHVHEARAYLGVLMAGPRLAQLKGDPYVPDRVTAFGQSHAPSPARIHQRDPSVEPATDDWPFLYLENRHLPAHYGIALLVVLIVSTVSVLAVGRIGVAEGSAQGPSSAVGPGLPPSPEASADRHSLGDGGQSRASPRQNPASPSQSAASSAASTAAQGWSWQYFLLGAGFMLLETKSIIQFALLWGSTWVVASLAIASVLTMALIANYVVSRTEIRRPWLVGGVLIALLAANYLVPIGRISFDSRAVESIFYAVLVFSPILCAGLLFGSAIKRSTSLARDYGTNLLGAMVGGVGEYLSLLTGFRVLLLLIALCYIGALFARRTSVVPKYVDVPNT
jgi:predicted membrane-bound spermidine synthase